MKEMNMKIKILTLLGFSLLFNSCNDFLEPENVGYRDEDYYLRLYEESRGLVEHVYASLGSGYQIEDAYLTDEAVMSKSLSTLATGGWMVTSDPFYVWNTAYDNMRNLYLYIDKVHKSGIPFFPYAEDRNDRVIRRYYGDCYFLKAWYEWELLKVYGGEATDGRILGFPIINEILANEEYMEQERNTYEECVAQILADLDTAAKYVPYAYEGLDSDIGATWKGKGSGRAIMALKARVLLWAASPTYNLKNSHDKWNAALTAAKEAIALDGGLHDLQNYSYNNTNNPDHFWRTRSTVKSSALEWAHYPGSLFGRGECNPSKNLIDRIPMANGYPITNPLSGYDPENPFDGRDSRFSNFFFFNNDSLLRGESKFWESPMEIYEGGKDYWGGIREDIGTRTGFYLKKFLNNLNLNPDGALDGGIKSDYSVCERLGRAELYLSLAEAAIGAGYSPTDDLGDGYTALDCVKKIRERAGIAVGEQDPYLEEMSGSAADFMSFLKNERSLELCFQGLRFFDLRRWKEPLEIINEPIRGIKVSLEEDGSFAYEEIPKVEGRAYRTNTYYLPLPYNEVVKSNGNLLQNKGWE